MTRDEAYKILTKYMQNKNLLKHSRAAEVAMQALYRRLTPENEQTTEDEEIWGISGLLHDIDYEVAQKENKLDHHGTFIGIAEKNDLPENIAHAIQAHAFVYSKVQPESLMDWSIVASDQLTGLITACALVRPDKKLGSVTSESVMKKFGTKAFAAGADRNAIRYCETELNIPLPEFIEIVLKAMQGISVELGL